MFDVHLAVDPAADEAALVARLTQMARLKSAAANPHYRKGPTSAVNGLGERELCNDAKEAPGWHVTAINLVRFAA